MNITEEGGGHPSPIAIVTGVGPAAPAVAVTDGDGHVAAMGIARKVSLSSLASSPLGTLAAGTHNSSAIDISPFSNMFWATSAAAGAGTADFYLDFYDSDGVTLLAQGVEHQAQFTGPGATYKNVGVVAGGAGFLLPQFVVLRTVVVTGPFTGINHVLIGR